MKVMLRCDQDRVQLDKADELYVPWHKRDLIEEIHRQYPKKTIMLDGVPADYDETELSMLAACCRGELKLLVTYDYFKDNPLVKRVLSYPMRSIYEMEIAYSNGINEFYIGAELLHQLNKVKGFKDRTKSVIRVKGNLAAFGYENAVSDDDLALGSYILPQEMELIDDVVDYIDFNVIDPAQEAAYYRIYFENKYWAGEVKMLIKDFDCKSLIRMIEPSEIRFRCNMGCLSGSTCGLCRRNLRLADPSLYKNLEKPEDLEMGEGGTNEVLQ